jgi:hypothetical protein
MGSYQFSPADYLAGRERADRIRVYEEFLARLSEPGSGLSRELLIRDAASELGYAEVQKQQYIPFERTNRSLQIIDPELEEQMWEWVVTGLVVPQVKSTSSHRSYIDCVRLTTRGHQLLRSSVPDSPFGVGLAASIKLLPRDVRSRLEDAQQCLWARLLRPAVIMVGLAYETLLQAVYEQARTAQLLAKKATVHADRITIIRKVVASCSNDIKGKADALRALDHAICVNTARNTAAHATPEDFEYEDVHALVASAPFWLRRLATLTPLLSAGHGVQHGGS